MERRCKQCRDLFTPRPNVAHQQCCSKTNCQAARRDQWRKRKLATDPDYRLNQYDAQKRWREKHPEYWREYRASHWGYVEKNRALQRHRNRKRREGVIANRDESSNRNAMRSGYYRLIAAGRERIAKSDEYLVKLDVIPRGYLQGLDIFPDCKQIT